MAFVGMSRRAAAGLVAVALLAGCRGSDREQEVGAAAPTTGESVTVVPSVPPSTPSTVPPRTTAQTGPAADSDPPPEIAIEQLFSPANATAEMTGTGARSTDVVTVDDAPADVVSFDVGPEGRFVVRVWIEQEGAHTVCVATACGRVYTLAPDALTDAEIEAQIAEALPLAREYVDHAVLFPDWRIVTGGPMAGTGGTADPETSTITIRRNRGRTVDDYIRTILHELGHVADFELLDDADRAAYLAVRGFPADTPWRSADAHRVDAWEHQPSEDFAELMVLIWTDGRWQPRTRGELGPPDAAVVAAVAALVG